MAGTRLIRYSLSMNGHGMRSIYDHHTSDPRETIKALRSQITCQRSHSQGVIEMELLVTAPCCWPISDTGHRRGLKSGPPSWTPGAALGPVLNFPRCRRLPLPNRTPCLWGPGAGTPLKPCRVGLKRSGAGLFYIRAAGRRQKEP